MTGILIVVALGGLMTSACVPRRWNLRAFPPCADKLPVKVLIHPGCPPDGVCGYSCVPGRWEKGAE